MYHALYWRLRGLTSGPEVITGYLISHGPQESNPEPVITSNYAAAPLQDKATFTVDGDGS